MFPIITYWHCHTHTLYIYWPRRGRLGSGRTCPWAGFCQAGYCWCPVTQAGGTETEIGQGHSTTLHWLCQHTHHYTDCASENQPWNRGKPHYHRGCCGYWQVKVHTQPFVLTSPLTLSTWRTAWPRMGGDYKVDRNHYRFQKFHARKNRTK